MSTPDPDKARNREIAQNEAHRETVSSVRVCSWAIGLGLVIGAMRCAPPSGVRALSPQAQLFA